MPSVVVPLLLLALGAALLTAGAEAFAEHVSAAAAGLNVSVLALAVLLAGAEPEEAVTAMLASGQGHPGLAAGDAIGANLVILTLVLGLAALVSRLPVDRRARQYAAAAAAASAVMVLLSWDGTVSRLEGGLLVLLYVVGVAWVWRRERQPPLIGEMAELDADDPADDPADAPAGAVTGAGSRARLMVLGGLIGMVAGGFLAVLGASGLVEVLDVTESVVGLTILALATSAEMLALVWAAHRRGVPEVVVAGAVGAVGYNATVSVGLGALVNPLEIGIGSPVTTVAAATVVLALLLVVAARSGIVPRPVGAVLVVGYVLATGWLFG